METSRLRLDVVEVVIMFVLRDNVQLQPYQIFEIRLPTQVIYLSHDLE